MDFEIERTDKYFTSNSKKEFLNNTEIFCQIQGKLYQVNYPFRLLSKNVFPSTLSETDDTKSKHIIFKDTSFLWGKIEIFLTLFFFLGFHVENKTVW